MRLLTILAVLGPTSGLACQEVIQSCTFNNGAKTVTVCLTPENVTYAFGPTQGTPELLLSVPITEVDYEPWPGVGNSIWESIRFSTTMRPTLRQQAFTNCKTKKTKSRPLLASSKSS